MTMVQDRRVRLLDKIGNEKADRAADFGRRRVQPSIIDHKGQVLSACRNWYPLVPDLHRFFIAIAGEAVNRMVMVVLLFILRAGRLVVLLTVGRFSRL